MMVVLAPKKRRVAVRDRAFLLGPLDLWVGSWISVAATPITCRDIEIWPYSVGMLVKWVSFLSSLQWPADGCILVVCGVSYVELLILYELWAGERLDLEKAVPRYRRAGRSISVSAVPFGPGIDIWRSCRFIGALCSSCGVVDVTVIIQLVPAVQVVRFSRDSVRQSAGHSSCAHSAVLEQGC